VGEFWIITITYACEAAVAVLIACRMAGSSAQEKEQATIRFHFISNGNKKT